MEFGEKIKSIRLSKDMTLEQVGEIVGVGKSTVRKWENGDIKNMGRDKIELLAKALGVTPGYLMGWTDDLPSVDDELWHMREDMRRNPELRAIFSLSRKTNKTKMKQIEDFVRFVTKGDDVDETDTP